MSPARRHSTDAIHADRQNRAAALDSFRKGTTNVIVATDVLARGIDVPEVDYVVNYDLPSCQDYVHRIGRTGRAGAGGFAVSFVTPDTKNLLKSIQKFIGQTIDVMEYKISEDAFEPLDNADPRVVAQGKAELEERAARKERERGRKGASMGEGKKGGKKKTRQRDKDRSAEFKRRKEAEAAGEEYIAPKRDHAEKGPRKPTLAERQAAAEEAFNAMFDMPNIPGEGSKKSKTKGKGGNGYSYAAFEKGKKHKGGHDGYERDYDEEPRNRKGKRSFDRDGDFGNRNDRFFDEGRNDRKPRGKKYSDKQYSDGRGSKPGKKFNTSGKRGASFE
ncbi:MAG: helicase-related protein, partial [Eggerthellaceae bacterium]